MKPKTPKPREQRPQRALPRGRRIQGVKPSPDAKISERRAANEAVIRMQQAPPEGDGYARRHGLRPLRPPPYRAVYVPNAGARALASDRRRGLV